MCEPKDQILLLKFRSPH